MEGCFFPQLLPVLCCAVVVGVDADKADGAPTEMPRYPSANIALWHELWTTEHKRVNPFFSSNILLASIGKLMHLNRPSTAYYRKDMQAWFQKMKWSQLFCYSSVGVTALLWKSSKKWSGEKKEEQTWRHWNYRTLLLVQTLKPWASFSPTSSLPLLQCATISYWESQWFIQWKPEFVPFNNKAHKEAEFKIRLSLSSLCMT